MTVDILGKEVARVVIKPMANNPDTCLVSINEVYIFQVDEPPAVVVAKISQARPKVVS